MDEDIVTRRTLACCYAVHRELGPGFPEVAYQHAITRELESTDLAFTRDVWLPVLYQGEEIERVHADFLVDTVLLEIRAKINLEKEDVVQTFACLKVSTLSRGLLVNFGADELQVRRLATTPRLT